MPSPGSRSRRPSTSPRDRAACSRCQPASQRPARTRRSANGRSRCRRRRGPSALPLPTQMVWRRAAGSEPWPGRSVDGRPHDHHQAFNRRLDEERAGVERTGKIPTGRPAEHLPAAIQHRTFVPGTWPDCRRRGHGCRRGRRAASGQALHVRPVRARTERRVACTGPRRREPGHHRRSRAACRLSCRPLQGDRPGQLRGHLALEDLRLVDRGSGAGRSASGCSGWRRWPRQGHSYAQLSPTLNSRRTTDRKFRVHTPSARLACDRRDRSR